MDLFQAEALQMAVSDYDQGKKSFPDDRHTLVLPGAKYCSAMRSLQKILEIPFDDATHKIIKALNYPAPVKEQIKNRMKGYSMERFRLQSYENSLHDGPYLPQG